jgi:hypothetical protein
LNNPKLEGSNLLDCIPQTGQCPNNCLECYYNADGFFRTKDEPLIPTLEDAAGKIIRVNSGHDSNIQKELVLETTARYPKKFFNTSMPNFDFPAPVVFTCNGRDTDKSAMMVVDYLDNLMAVRFRTNPWNLGLLEAVMNYYTAQNTIPLTITFMRYTKLELIPEEHQESYEFKESILNTYYILKKEVQEQILTWERVQLGDIWSSDLGFYKDKGEIKKMVGMCGTSTSSLCKDCSRCEMLYNRITNKK